MEGLGQNQESPGFKRPEKWGEFEPQIKINGIDALLRAWNVQADEKGRVIKTTEDRKKTIMPRIEKRALIILNGGRHGYGSRIDTGKEEKHEVEITDTFRDKIKKKFGRPRTEEITREKYIQRIPDNEKADEFSKTYFALQKLVKDGIFTPPTTGNDGPTLNDFFFETTRPMEVSELVALLKNSGINVEKSATSV